MLIGNHRTSVTHITKEESVLNVEMLLRYFEIESQVFITYLASLPLAYLTSLALLAHPIIVSYDIPHLFNLKTTWVSYGGMQLELRR